MQLKKKEGDTPTNSASDIETKDAGKLRTESSYAKEFQWNKPFKELKEALVAQVNVSALSCCFQLQSDIHRY